MRVLNNDNRVLNRQYRVLNRRYRVLNRQHSSSFAFVALNSELDEHDRSDALDLVAGSPNSAATT